MHRETGSNGDHDYGSIDDDHQRRDTVTIDVFHTIRGDRKTSDRAADAEQLRHDFRRNDIESVSLVEFGRLYEHVGSETIAMSRSRTGSKAGGDGIDDYEEVMQLLSEMWDRWTRGGKSPSRSFMEAETRSLEVGDLLALDGAVYVVAPMGFHEIELDIGSEGSA